jgi:hypothetical protein
VSNQFPPRVWVHKESYNNPKAMYFVARNEKCDAHEYLPLEESNAILSEAVAKAWEEAADLVDQMRDQQEVMAGFGPEIMKKMKSKAAEIRGKK